MDDLIRRSDAIEAIEVVDWYHQNRNKDMVSGANSDEHQAWYKADDVYKALEAVPSADRPQGKMSRWIDADNAIERLGVYLMTDAQIEYGGLASEDIDDWKPIAIDILKGAPSIDIVRCRECKHREEYPCKVYHDDDWYCADGERESE